MPEKSRPHKLASTGIGGLDEALHGGFPAGHMYLLHGPPGSGKTTLALQFLLEGVRHGERGVYVTLSETEQELRAIASSHGWNLRGITVCDLQAAEATLRADSQYTLFHPAEVELSETTQTVLREIERVEPARVVFDSLSEMRLLARDSLRYRRQILALKHYFNRAGTTVLLLDTGTDGEYQLSSVAHGVVQLDVERPCYGACRRRLRLVKMRGLAYREGDHDFTISTGGICVYPRLVAAEDGSSPVSGFSQKMSSGLPELDAMLGGGLELGTSTLVLGPSGAGKSTVAMQYVRHAIDSGHKAAVLLFDEGLPAWLLRARSLGMPMEEHRASGALSLTQVNPAELSPGALSWRVRRAVEDDGMRVVVIDSLNGYQESMPAERFLSLHLHELLTYLNGKRVLSLLTMVQHGILGQGIHSPLELSYVADTVLLLRFFEAFGQVRRAVSVVKKRVDEHEREIRELSTVRGKGLTVGRRLRAFTGVLSGQPVFHGHSPELLAHDDATR